jgi:hypothetical protein
MDGEIAASAGIWRKGENMARAYAAKVEGGMEIWHAEPFGLGGDMPLLLLASGFEPQKQLEEIAWALQKDPGAKAHSPFALACFGVEDWQAAYSPWAAPALRKGEKGFAGEGPATLAFLEERALPKLEEALPISREPGGRALFGYSLAGLFALWALYESRLFSGAGCCSGSLWFKGWMGYMRSFSPKAGSRVYLSLGKKEENARNSLLASVGGCAREAEGILGRSPAVKESALAWHSGGHGHEPARRLADAALWLLKGLNAAV